MHAQHVSDLPRQRQRLQGQIGRTTLAPETKAAVLAFLDRLPDDQVLCHGDFHPENILMTADGPVIIDWVDATQGHPLADVARTSLLLRLGGIPAHVNENERQQLTQMRQLFCEAYLERYLQLRPASAEAISRWEAPVAAGRLAEGFDQDERLLAVVRKALAP
jgi:aminoglycoside phosphotransferase (APT) family kinase protein